MKKQIKFLAVITIILFAANFKLNCLQAQNVVTTGTNVKISSGTYVTSSQDFVVQNGAGLNVEGLLILKKNFSNQNPSGDLGIGTLKFEGTAAQSISGQNTMGSLQLNNASGLDINGNTTVNNALGLQNGHIRLGANNLTLGTAASVSGTPSPASMVVATGTGEMRKSFSGNGSFNYPVGDNTGTAEYTPVALTFTGGTFGAGNYAGLKLTNAAYAGASGNYLDRYWAASQSGITNPQYDAVFQYVPADVVGNESDISCVQVEPAPTVAYNAANTMLHQLTAIGLTTFGTFTGAQAMVDKLLTLNFFLEGLYAGGGVMNKAQNGAGDQFAGNTADQVAIELHDGGNYGNTAYTETNVSLTTNGVASVSVPAVHNGSYYVTVNHRNSVVVTTSVPVSFSAGAINYNFDLPAKAFGDNLKLMGDGQYAIFGGDINQDGAVDGLDMIEVDNQAANFGSGYIPEDINGDGSVDALDMIILDNNAAAFVSAILP